MRKFSAVLLAIFLFSLTLPAEDEPMSPITVKKSQTNGGVVFVDIVRAGKAFELQCNDGAPSCVALKAGNYKMREMPKNWGMYDCKDVQIYPESAEEDAGDKLGEYCLISSAQ